MARHDDRSTAGRVTPERSDELAHLTIDKLRVYRRALGEEENRVSYWRRIVQARLDLVRSGVTADPAQTDSLRDVLTASRSGGSRGAFVTIVPPDDIPPLPDLTELWERDTRPGDDEHNERLLDDLVEAEQQLSAYRTALHGRLSTATAELIARYRDEPNLCLSVLPLARDGHAAGRVTRRAAI